MGAVKTAVPGPHSGSGPGAGRGHRTVAKSSSFQGTTVQSVQRTSVLGLRGCSWAPKVEQRWGGCRGGISDREQGRRRECVQRIPPGDSGLAGQGGGSASPGVQATGRCRVQSLREQDGRREAQQPTLVHRTCFHSSLHYDRESPGETETPAARRGALDPSVLCTPEGESPPWGPGNTLRLIAGEPVQGEAAGPRMKTLSGPAPWPCRGEA